MSDSEFETDSSSESYVSEDDIEEISKEWIGKIYNDNYLCLKYLGRGTFCRVFLVYDFIYDNFYAMKVLFTEYTEEGLHELEIYETLNSNVYKNPNIVYFHQSFFFENYFVLIIEFMGMDLIDLLNFSNLKKKYPTNL